MTKKGRNSPFRALHDGNRQRVLAQVLGGDRVTRQEIKERTGLTDATVSRITRDFIDIGLMSEGEKVVEPSSKGRHRVEVNIDPDAGFVVGVCLSAFQRTVSLVNIRGHRKWQRQIPKKVMTSPTRTIKFIVDAVNSYIGESGTPRQRVLGVGVVVAGSVDHTHGNIVHAPLLHWKNTPIAEMLRDRLALAIAVRNVADALCISCSDRLYSDRGAHLSMFLVHVAVGMGASLMVNRRIVQRRGDEAWIARVPIGAFDQDSTTKRLGDVVSGKAILQAIHGSAAVLGDVTRTLQSAVNVANEGSAVERKVFLEAGRLLGRALSVVTASFLPDVLVLAGPVSQAEPFRDGAETAYRDCSELIDSIPAEMVMNTMTYLDAAENLALRRFLLPGLLSFVEQKVHSVRRSGAKGT